MFTQYKSNADFRKMLDHALDGVPGHYDKDAIVGDLCSRSVMGPQGYEDVPRLDTFWAVVANHRLDTGFHEAASSFIHSIAGRHQGEGVMSEDYSRSVNDSLVLTIHLMRGDYEEMAVACHDGGRGVSPGYLAITPKAGPDGGMTSTYSAETVLAGLIYIEQWFEKADS